MKRLLTLAIAPTAVVLGFVALLADERPADRPSSVLITNDDGIDTPGIGALARSLAESAAVHVVAPSGNRSGSSTYAISLSQGMTVDEVDLGGAVASAHSISGFPADAVLWGVRHLLADAPPDLVISGINDGANAGGAWPLSGTVGAARMAAFLGIPSLAVSGYDSDDEEAVRQVVAWLTEFVGSPVVEDLEPGEYLLVNMPSIRMEDVAGVVVAPLDLDYLSIGMSQVEGSETWRARLGRGDVTPGGDWASLGRDEIVITPMRFGETDDLESFRGLLGSVPDPRNHER